jgi:uncharacterized protein
MIVLLSPAKTLDYSPADYPKYTEPRLLNKSDKLIQTLQKKSVNSLRKLMDVSENIARLNRERYAGYHTPFLPGESKQAILAFKGDVYTGLDADTLEADDLEFAQKHIRILSGLYGLLAPLDLMYPYRLEMGTSLKVGRKKNLYEFWDDKITSLINEDLATVNGKFIINLASVEYFKSVHKNKLSGTLINIHFQENRNGDLKVISFNAKKARGGMTRQIILERIENPEEIKELKVDGYSYSANLSDSHNWYFIK